MQGKYRKGIEEPGGYNAPHLHIRTQTGLVHVISYKETFLQVEQDKSWEKWDVSEILLLSLFEKEIYPEYIHGAEAVCRVDLSLNGYFQVFTLRPSNFRENKKRRGPCMEQALKPGLWKAE